LMVFVGSVRVRKIIAPRLTRKFPWSNTRKALSTGRALAVSTCKIFFLVGRLPGFLD